MSFLGESSGQARILVNDEDLGEVSYHVVASRPRNMVKITGTIAGEDSVLYAAFDNLGASLRFEDGSTVGILVKNHEPGVGRAKIRVNGRVPGLSHLFT